MMIKLGHTAKTKLANLKKARQPPPVNPSLPAQEKHEIDTELTATRSNHTGGAGNKIIPLHCRLELRSPARECMRAVPTGAMEPRKLISIADTLKHMR